MVFYSGGVLAIATYTGRMARRFWTMEYALALVVVVGDFVSWAIKLIRALIRHSDVPAEYFVGLAATAYLTWFLLQHGRRKLRASEAQDKDAVTT